MDEVRDTGDLLQLAENVLDLDAQRCAALDAVGAPVYVTDADGYIIYFNPACTDFAGRTPSLEQDRWCVTWKLYTEEGEFLPHEECPMAVAIRHRRVVRGATAVAERPDGSRVNFMPFPTPVLSRSGALLGAVNLIVDITGERRAAELAHEARRYRRLATSTTDTRTFDILSSTASEYEQRVVTLARPVADGNALMATVRMAMCA